MTETGVTREAEAQTAREDMHADFNCFQGGVKCKWAMCEEKLSRWSFCTNSKWPIRSSVLWETLAIPYVFFCKRNLGIGRC